MSKIIGATATFVWVLRYW